jgi:ABC-type branched-subunit amino acid transport system substrate-binding protein
MRALPGQPPHANPEGRGRRAPLPAAALLLAAALWTALGGAAAAQMPAPTADVANGSATAPEAQDEAPPEAPTDSAAVEEGDALYADGNLQGAVVAYKQMLAAFPDSPYQPKVLYRLGDALARLNRQDEARIYWERLLATAPDAPFAESVEESLLPIYRREGQLDKALDIMLGRLGRAPVERKGDILVEVADLRLDLGDPERAIRDLMRRLKYLPPEERGQGSARIKEIIDTRLKVRDLTDLADRFPEAMPGAWIVERLVRTYAGQSEAYQTEKWGNRYIAAYPDRPFADEARDLIREQKRQLRAHRHRVGVLLHLSGDMGPYGDRVLKGIQVAYHAARDRLPEGEVALWVRDLDAEAPIFSSHVAALVRDAEPDVLIGPMLSGEVRDAARAAARARIPLIAPLVPRPSGVGPIVVGLGITPEMEGIGAARLAARDDLLHCVVVAPDGPYGQRVTAAFGAELVRLGGEVQATVLFGADEQDIRDRVKVMVDQDIRKGGVPAVTADDMAGLPESELELAGLAPEPEIQIGTEPHPPLQGPPIGPHGYYPTFDAVFLPGPWDRVAVAAPFLPFQDIDVPIIGTSGWNDPRLIATGGAAVTGARFVSALDREGPVGKAFFKAYREAYGEAPDLFAALGYDAMQLALRGVVPGGGDPWMRLAGPYTGATGSFTVEPDGSVVRTLSVLKVGQNRFAPAGEVSLGDTPAGPEAASGPQARSATGG